jgi:N-acetylglucosamine-6-phosphate deacetylase
VNGYKGVDFNAPDLTPENIRKVSSELLSIGVSTYFPTLITGPADRVSASLKTLASSEIGGIHLEGPFISAEDGPRGAHPKKQCRLPDGDLVKKWQEEALGRIKIMTLAPELPGSKELIKICRDLGMVVAIGHTAASGEQIRRAVEAGAKLSTHLGNGAHAVLPRHPNYIWEQLAEEELFASMIADGFHLGPSVLKVFARTKGEKGILVSDSMVYAGMPAGNYDSPAAGKVCLTEEGKLHIQGKPGLLAGSASTLPKGVNHMAELIPFPLAWDMGSVNASRLMNPYQPCGLEVGAPADLVLLHLRNGKMEVSSVCKRGVPLEINDILNYKK